MVEKKRGMNRFLDHIERVGNRLPDPLSLFVILCVAVILVSWIAASIGIEVTHPSNGQTIAVQSLLSKESIYRMLNSMVSNFAAFPPLGLVLVTMIGIGVAEQSGLISAGLKKLVMAVPKRLLTATLVFAGITANLAADAGYVVLTPLGAMLFAAVGRHPIAGLAAVFAGVSGGFSANLFFTQLDPLLAGISTTAAHIMDPSYVVQPTANYYFNIISTFVLVIAGTWVTDYVVEPRLGKWQREENSIDDDLSRLEPREKRGLWVAGVVFLLCLIITGWMVFPSDGILRSPEGGIEPFLNSLVPILMLTFLFCGIAYGLVAGTVKSDKDIARMSSDSMATMGSYIVLAFIASQFVAYFSWSNLGIVSAIAGASGLQAIGLTGAPLILTFIIVSAMINLLIGSASAKWAIMGPVFIPMLMLMGYSPELTQAAYRVGDSTTNIITPLMPYFPIIISFAQKYDKKVGIGTLISVMLPYSIAFFVMWAILLIVWMVFGFPLGPDAPLYYTAPTGG
ncbi:MAG: AbgT family transporter [Oligoflexus sp.]